MKIRFRFSISRIVPAIAAATTGFVNAADDRPAPALPLSAQESVLKALSEAWPDRPEWLDMYTDILAGSQLGPNDGWFRRAVSATRYDWPWARNKFDSNADGQIDRAEFPGSDADFARLDRDRDTALTEADFDFSEHALAPTVGMAVFRAMDRNSDGKLTSEELNAFVKRADSGNLGYLSLSDVKNALDPKKPPARPSNIAAKPAGPSKETLIRGLFAQEVGSLQPGPAIGDKARDFTLKTNDGKGEATLSKVIGTKPVVLVFGNFTCGPFRMQAGNVEKLYRRYGDRANFLMIYVREAHPTDGWQMESNESAGVSLPQPSTYEERAKVARVCGDHLKLGFPMLVDTIDDTVGAYFSGMPSRLYLIDSEGRIAFKNGRGPFGFKPDELEHSLLLMLQDAPKIPSESAD